VSSEKAIKKNALQTGEGRKTTIKRFRDYVTDMETLPRAFDEIISLVF
jgi:hypothetical protein